MVPERTRVRNRVRKQRCPHIYKLLEFLLGSLDMVFTLGIVLTQLMACLRNSSKKLAPFSRLHIVDDVQGVLHHCRCCLLPCYVRLGTYFTLVC